MTPGDRPIAARPASARAPRGPSSRPPAPSVDERDLVELEAAPEVRPQRLAVVRMDAAADEDPLAPRRAAGHERGLGRRGGAVVVRRGDDVEVDQLGDQRLVLVDALERALADLGLVRRVGRVPLAAEQDLVDGRRAPVAVDAGAEERGEVGPVARGQGRAAGPRARARAPAAGGRAARRAGASGMSSKSSSTEVSAEGREHPLAVVGGMRSVGHRRSARRDERVVGVARRAARRAGAASASRTRTIQPSPYGSLLTSSGVPARASLIADDLAADRGEQVAHGLDRLDDAEGRELLERRARRRAARRRRCRRAGRRRRR